MSKKQKKVIIFGTNKIAECALAFFREDKIGDVAAFTVDPHCLGPKEWHGLPVVPYTELARKYPAEQYQIFVAVGYSDLNRNREKIMDRVRSDGYQLSSCISPRSIVMPGVSIGANAFIFHGCIIDPYVTIGQGVLIGSNTIVGHHSVVEDYCYLTYGTVIAGSAKVGHHSILGCNSTIGVSTSIGPFNIVGDGAMVCRSTEENSVYFSEQTAKGRLSSERIKKMIPETIDARSRKEST